VKIGDRKIGPGEPPYVIAEIGVNHDGEMARALELTEAAAKAGADAVKLQYFETDRLLSKAAKLAAYQRAAGETDPVAMLRRLELTLDEMALVVDRAHELGIHAIVTVFSVELVERAETLAWDAYKSASPDVINRPLLEALAATGKPLIVSTGASTLDEVARAVGWLEGIRDRLAVLQCVSCYPTRLEDAALGGVEALMSIHGGPVGYSDHTAENNTVTLIAPLGACVFEKHLTYDQSGTGPDHRASLEPEALEQYVKHVRSAAVSPDGGETIAEIRTKLPFSRYFGEVQKVVLDCERDVREVARQSVTTTRFVAVGEILTRNDLTTKRPGSGLEAFRLDKVVGRTLARDVEADTPLAEDDLA